MTNDELNKFCVDNAGKLATGTDKNGKKREGRITACAALKTQWILLEDTKLDKAKLPTDKQVPFIHERWLRVVHDCHLGIPCLAETIQLIGTETAKTVITSAPPLPAPNQWARCGHARCSPYDNGNWCVIKYTGETI